MPRKTDLNLPKERTMITPAPAYKRLLAAAVDFLIIQFVILAPLGPVIEAKIPNFSDLQENYAFLESNPGLISDLTPVFLTMFFLMFLYFTVFEKKMAQTPGKMLLRIRVESIDKGPGISVMQAIARNLVILVFYPFWVLVLVDIGYLIFTGNRLSDRFSKTNVVEEVVIT
jgi:uncharacterized RDD family membrane protein YckC